MVGFRAQRLHDDVLGRDVRRLGRCSLRVWTRRDID